MKKRNKKGLKKAKTASPMNRGDKKVKLNDIMTMRLKAGKNVVREKFLLGSKL